MNDILQAIAAIIVAIVSWKLGNNNKTSKVIEKQNELLKTMAKVMDDERHLQEIRYKINNCKSSDDFNLVYNEILNVGNQDTPTRISKKS